ncbi:MAG: polysaccharide deacetylase family protein, partial [Bdellovibrionota bacterium]
EALLSKASRLELDLAQAAATGKEERERARGLAEQALAAEDKAKGLAAELEKLRARHSDTQQDREVLEKELAREREAGQRERAALQAKLDDLSERLRRAEREAGAAQAGQMAVLKRAEAAEGLVRQRLRLVSSQSTPGAVAAAGGVDQVTLEHLAALEDQSRRIEEQLARFEKQAGAQQAEPVSLRADLDKLAQVTQRIEDQIRTLSPATASPHHPAPALDPALRERLLTLEGQTDEIGKHLREVAALLSQPEKVPAGQEVLREELRRSAETQARELDTLKKKLDALAESSLAAGAPGPSRERPNWPLVAAIAGGILITLVGSLYLLIDFRLNRERRQLAQIFGAGPAAIAKPLPLPRLTRPEPDSLVKSERAALAGEAAGADAVFLFLNDSLYAVELVRGGKFSFESIPFEAGTTRVGLRSVGSNGAASDLWETSLVHPAPEGEAPAPFVRDLFRGDPEKRWISLTFDGDGAAGTEEVLEVLRAHNLKMTMFLTGGFIEERPDLAKKIVGGGHEVGNHLWDHPHLTTFDSNSRHDTRPNVTKAFFQGQLIRTASLFEEVTGKKMAPYWRAPFGEVNPELLRWAMELGYQHVNWTRDYSRNETLDSWDWVVDKNSHRYQTNDEIVRRLLSFGRTSESSANGGIVLMHLGTQRPAGDALHERLPNLIRGWQEQGYEFVKISKMTGKE